MIQEVSGSEARLAHGEGYRERQGPGGEAPHGVTQEAPRQARGLARVCARGHGGAQEQIRHAAEKYLIFYGALTPIVYTTVKDSGVQLTIRYLVDPRQRRTTDQQIWEATLDAFAEEDDVALAYPTTRFYGQERPTTGSG